jgi:hypothetical protein
MGYPEEGTATGQGDRSGAEVPLRSVATIDCPDGCDAFFCALPPECVVRTNDQQRISGVRSYHVFYKTKPFDMKWNRGKDTPPSFMRRNDGEGERECTSKNEVTCYDGGDRGDNDASSLKEEGGDGAGVQWAS